MTTSERFAISHKDLPPEETIRNIREKLFEIGIFVSESRWFSFGDFCYSVLLSDDHLPRLVTNGKGLTRELALASAYGEMMEHIQNGPNPKMPGKYGLMPETWHCADEKTLPLGSISKTRGPIVASLFGGPLPKRYRDVPVTCLPYFEVFAGSVDLLPDELIFNACGSNGWCAGNSAAEALVHGLCEVFERYAMIQALVNPDVEFPTIPLDEISRLPSYRIIKSLVDQGYTVIVKDCTFGGKLPVLCVVVHERRGGHLMVRFGSDPILDIALQRCLTELFQGLESGHLDDDMTSLPWSGETLRPDSFPNDFSILDFINKASLPYVNCLLSGRKSGGEYQKAFNLSDASNAVLAADLFNRLRASERKLYIRQVSFLGFPAYRIYVPGMSEVDPRLTRALLEFRSMFSSMKATLLSLPERTEEEIAQGAKDLEKLYRDCYYFLAGKGDVWPLYLMDLRLEPESEGESFFKIDFLLAMLFYRIGDYAKAVRYLERHLQKDGFATRQEDAGTVYWRAVLALLRYKQEGMSDPLIEESLTDLFGQETAVDVLNDFAERENIFSLFKLPQCGCCAQCAIQPHCSYPYWRERITVLKGKMEAAGLEQTDIALQ
jgi:ribosomal protein S12 methylthiotransferase accessory factor